MHSAGRGGNYQCPTGIFFEHFTSQRIKGLCVGINQKTFALPGFQDMGEELAGKGVIERAFGYFRGNSLRNIELKRAFIQKLGAIFFFKLQESRQLARRGEISSENGLPG